MALKKSAKKGNWKQLIINRDNIDSLFDEKIYKVVNHSVYTFDSRIPKSDREDVVQTAILRTYKSLIHKMNKLEAKDPIYVEKFYGKNYNGEIKPEINTTEGLFYSFLKMVCFNCVRAYRNEDKLKNATMNYMDCVDYDRPINDIIPDCEDTYFNNPNEENNFSRSYLKSFVVDDSLDTNADFDFTMYAIKETLTKEEFDLLKEILQNKNFTSVKQLINMDNKTFDTTLKSLRVKIKNSNILEFANGTSEKTN